MHWATRTAVLMLLVAVLVAAGWAVQQSFPLDWLVERERHLRSAIAARPIRSWLIGLAIYAALSLTPGTTGKSVVYGWLFGWLPAVVIVNLSLTFAAVTTFSISRYLLRDMIRSRYGHYLERLEERLQPDAAGYALSLRLIHAPFTAVNYTLGAASNLPLKTFWWTTQLGLLPSTMIFVFAGARLPTLQAVAQRGVMAILDPWLFAALIITAVAPLVWARFRWKSSVAPRPADRG